MGLFDMFKKKKANDAVSMPEPFADIPEAEDGTDDDNDNAYDYVWEMYEKLGEKCSLGDNMDALNGHERVVYVTLSLEEEVNNGGFSQYFFNSAGDLCGELVYSFTEIGAHKTAAICKKAISACGKEFSSDRMARREMLDRYEKKCGKEFEKLDDEFYEYSDNLALLNYAYVIKHSGSFK